MVSQRAIELAEAKVAAFSSKDSHFLEKYAHKCFLVEAAVEEALADATQNAVDSYKVK